MRAKRRTLASRGKRHNGTLARTVERTAKKPRKGKCECTSRAGVGKKLYPSRWQASRTAGESAREGFGTLVWETYKCPSGMGWHIASVRVDPWKVS